MSRYLGIDYGNKRIGIAISDEEGKFAFPRLVITARLLMERLKKIILENSIKTVVVGLPQNFSGEDTKQTKRVRVFAELLKKESNVEIIFENEILTSRQIERTGVSTKEMIDASSAALILQGYLDRKNNVTI